jgi:hypothetical protein
MLAAAFEEGRLKSPLNGESIYPTDLRLVVLFFSCKIYNSFRMDECGIKGFYLRLLFLFDTAQVYL